MGSQGAAESNEADVVVGKDAAGAAGKTADMTAGTADAVAAAVAAGPEGTDKQAQGGGSCSGMLRSPSCRALPGVR